MTDPTILYRLEQAEKALTELKRSTVSREMLEARLELIRADIKTVREQISEVAEDGKSRRRLTYGAVAAAIGSLLVALILGGAFSTGG